MKGHPILGVTTGFFFGLFLGIALFLYGVIPLASDLLWILPLLGILLGLIMAAWAPFGKGPGPSRKQEQADASTAPAPPPENTRDDETGEMELAGPGDGEDGTGPTNAG
jgi:predicted lipid-binding transport protein (Tim44 family)